MRKVIGAQRSQLINQFIGESLLTASGAMALAVVLGPIALSTFNRLSGKSLQFEIDRKGQVLFRINSEEYETELARS